MVYLLHAVHIKEDAEYEKMRGEGAAKAKDTSQSLKSVPKTIPVYGKEVKEKQKVYRTPGDILKK